MHRELQRPRRRHRFEPHQNPQQPRNQEEPRDQDQPQNQDQPLNQDEAEFLDQEFPEQINDPRNINHIGKLSRDIHR